MSVPTITTEVVDGAGAVLVMAGERKLGTVAYQKGNKGGKLPGWATQGCVLGPLAQRHATPEAAIEVLVDHQLNNRRAC